ncbi:hypothetical protein JCM19235_2122 [Vibrio maritimus]|uniref:Arylsulfatase n=1 Tax=Vibrio maritimus TaxID=990268 RepID=A0A090RWT9_9VIBR|nr:hypothetical protein JCM19235_2122 [Vibrio maritimus]
MSTLKTNLGVGFAIAASSATIQAQEKPNILVIWGDDIGYFNLSIHNQA